MHPVPQKLKGGGVPVDRRCNRGYIVQMLRRRHTQTSKGFNVRIAVVQSVNVLVETPHMNDAMRKKEMNFSKEWDQNDTATEIEQSFPILYVPTNNTAHDFLVPLVSNATGRVEMDHDRFPRRPLHASQDTVPYIMTQFGPSINTSLCKGTGGPSQSVQCGVPESVVQQHNGHVETGAL